MRLSPLIAAATLVLSFATPALAQEWDEFVFVDDGFKVNFPGAPKVENTTWMSRYRYTLPARVYRASRGTERYSVTVVDYRGVDKQGIARQKQCPPGAETCIGTQDGVGGSILGAGYWKMDVRGALAWATLQFLKRDARVTDYDLEFQDVVEGYFMSLTNRDESRTYGYITMHENRLYILEGTVPKGYPEPQWFQSSMGFVDAKGNGIRYLDYYSNAIHGLRQYAPPPARVGGVVVGGQPGAAPAGAGASGQPAR
ncbi:MAG: hypothetical protein HY824_05830 [Acidobacteria bacterium]|nr:hypothetical protein [Acidobacteriota bacterium]